MVKIRLRRVGAKKQPHYRVVVADSRSPRDGKFIETIGHYNPRTEPPTMEIKADRALYWLSVGAQPSEAVRRMLDKLGILEHFAAFKRGEVTLEAPVETPVDEAEPVEAEEAAEEVAVEEEEAEEEEGAEEEESPEAEEEDAEEEVEEEESPEAEEEGAEEETAEEEEVAEEETAADEEASKAAEEEEAEEPETKAPDADESDDAVTE